MRLFGAKLKDVFTCGFPCASHQPAAFCMLHPMLLLLITAFQFNHLYEISCNYNRWI